MLENVWIIPALTFVSFWLILFFGKRLPKGGSEIGILFVGAALALSDARTLSPALPPARGRSAATASAPHRQGP